MCLPTGETSLTQHAMQYQESVQKQNQTGSPPAIRRMRLWELETELHCSVIGTCVPVKELRRIYRKISKRANKQFSDYQIHSLFVQGAGKAHDGTRLLHKYLERTYKTVIQRFSKAHGDDELGVLWNEALEKGDIAGAYWALVTHPHLSEELAGHAFGEVHMRSHLAGAAQRADQRRHYAISRDYQALNDKLTKQDTILQQLRTRYRHEHERWYSCQLLLQQREQQLGKLQQRLQELENGTERLSLCRQLDELNRQLNAVAKNTAERYEMEVGDLNTRIGDLTRQLDEQQRDNESLESWLQALMETNPTACCNGYAETAPDLCGRCILYVGGRSRSKPHFRHLVEQLNGRYLYHDGGLEDAWQRLQGLLQKADAVFCPIECISHGAVATIKRWCKREAKPVIMLRSDSFAAFSREIHQVAVNESN